MFWILAALALDTHTLGRLTFIEPKQGMHRDLEEGYKRHLAWHARKNDPWTWLGWTIVLGERWGTMVDASLDHTAEELSRPVDPAEDAADNERNSLPYAARLETYIVRYRDDLGRAGDLSKAPLLQVFDYRLTPSGTEAFVAALRTMNRSCAVFEFVNGGELPRFWVVIPAASLAEVNLATVNVIAPESVRTLRSEVLRYRPDLSYAPAKP